MHSVMRVSKYYMKVKVKENRIRRYVEGEQRSKFRSEAAYNGIIKRGMVLFTSGF